MNWCISYFNIGGLVLLACWGVYSVVKRNESPHHHFPVVHTQIRVFRSAAWLIWLVGRDLDTESQLQAKTLANCTTYHIGASAEKQRLWSDYQQLCVMSHLIVCGSKFICLWGPCSVFLRTGWLLCSSRRWVSHPGPNRLKHIFTFLQQSAQHASSAHRPALSASVTTDSDLPGYKTISP